MNRNERGRERKQRRQQRQRHSTIAALGIGVVALLLPAAVWRGLAQRAPSARRVTVPRMAGAASNGVTARTVKIVAAARAQKGTVYDPSYVSLPYPNGDVPKDRGACTDVVIRALRAAGYDLQKLVHEDMKRHFGLYPRQWGARRTDASIDHRRVPNLQVFFERRGQTLTKEVAPGTLAQWQPGDIVTWKFDNGLDHCGVLSDQRNATGLPLVVHNLAVCAEEDVLTAWKITGHYRFPPGL